MEYIPAVASASAARTPSDNRSASSASSNNSASARANSAPTFGDLVRQSPEPRDTDRRDAASIDEVANDTSEKSPAQNTAGNLGRSDSSAIAPTAENEPDIEADEADEILVDTEHFTDFSAVDPSQLPLETSLSVADALSSNSIDIAQGSETALTTQIEQSLAPESSPKVPKPLDEALTTDPAGTANPLAEPSESQPSASEKELASKDRLVTNAESAELVVAQTEDLSTAAATPTVGQSEITNTDQAQEVVEEARSADSSTVLAENVDSSPNAVASNFSQSQDQLEATPSKLPDTLGSAPPLAGSLGKFASQPPAESSRGSAALRQQRLLPIVNTTEAAANASPIIAEPAASTAETPATTAETDESVTKPGHLETHNANSSAELDPSLLTEDGERRWWGQTSRRTDSAMPATAELSTADRVRLVQRIAGAFQASLDRGGAVSLSLHPPDLGQLNVEVQMRDGKLSARMEAENTSVQQLLLDSLPQLRDRLAEHQIKIEQFQVDVMNQHNSHFAQTPHDRPDRQRNAETLLPPSSLNSSEPNKGSQPNNRPDQASRLNGAPWMLDRLNVIV